MRKKTRQELVVVIRRLQFLVGTAKGAYQNDRDPHRAEHVVRPLEEAFNLCVAATEGDPP